MAERASRIPKVDTIPPDWLLHMARQWLFETKGNRSAAYVKKILNSAANRNQVEARWLLDVFSKIRNFDGGSKWRWLRAIAKILASDESPRAKFYRGMALVRLNQFDEVGEALILQSAESGFAPAMGELGRPRWTSFQKDSEALDWLQRAADDNNVDGLYYLGQLSFEKPNLQKHYYELGAAHGDARCMYFAATDWPNHVYFNAALAARGLLLDAVTDRLHRIVYMMTRFAIKPTDHNGFAMGRELEGYQSFWDQPVCEVLSSNALLSQCVETFLEISHRARRAALFTVVMLLEHRFPRDVARMIARIVYQSRENPELWDKKEQQNKRNKRNTKKTKTGKTGKTKGKTGKTGKTGKK